MADNITLNPGTGGPEVRTIDRGGVETQVMLLDIGGAGAESLVTSGNPLPVAPNFTRGTGNADANTQRVTLAADGPAVTALTAIDSDLGTPADAAYTGSGSASVIAALKGVYSLLAAPLPAGTNAIGTVTANAGTGTFAVSASSLPLPAGAATSALQTTANTSLANLDFDLGAQADAAADTDTGTFSLIALTKRQLTKFPAALGQTNMAGSLSVALASDQSALNVNPDNVLDSLTTSGSVTSATVIVSVSTAGFQGGSFQVTSAGTSCTITYEQSNDGATWVSLAVITPFAVAVPSNTSTTASIYNFTCSAAFVRARVSTYGSGTVAVTLTQKRFMIPAFMPLGSSGNSIGTINGSVTVSGISAGTNTIGNLTRQSGFTDSSTALAANATFTGTGRVTTGANYPFFVANVFADQNGTLFIDLSTNSGTTYRTIKTQAVTAGTAAELEAKVTGAAGTATLYRVRYTNGATLQGAFQLSSAFRA